MFFLPREVASKVLYLQKLEIKFFLKISWFQLISLNKLFAVERVFKKFDRFFLERNIIIHVSRIVRDILQELKLFKTPSYDLW